MRTITLLFSLLLIAAIGCGDTAVTENSKSDTGTAAAGTAAAGASVALDQVDAVGLESVLAANSVTLIDFTAVWWGPCKTLKPGLQKMAGEFEGKVKFVAVDVDDSGDVAETYAVKAMPTLIVVKDGKEVDRVVGADEKAIRSMIESAM